MKITMNSSLSEVMNNEQAVKMISQALPTITRHPRFSEALNYTLREIIEDDFGAIIGVPKAKIKQLAKKLMELE